MRTAVVNHGKPSLPGVDMPIWDLVFFVYFFKNRSFILRHLLGMKDLFNGGERWIKTHQGGGASLTLATLVP